MGRSKTPDEITIKKLESDLDELFGLLVDFESSVARSKALQSGEKFQRTGEASWRIVRERFEGLSSSLTRTLREYENDSDIDVQLKSAANTFKEIKTKVERLKSFAKKGKVSIWGLNSLKTAKERLTGLNALRRKA